MLEYIAPTIYYMWREKDKRYWNFSYEIPNHINFTTIAPPQFNASVEYPYWNGSSWDLIEHKGE